MSNGPLRIVTTRDGSRTLQGDGESFKSLSGALTEARWVYLEGSGVGQRLRSGRPTRLLEIGFGSGLLFLVSAALATQAGTPLQYVGVEQQPPDAATLAELGYAQLLAPSTLPAQLIAWRRSAPLDMAVQQFSAGPVTLQLHVGDALSLPWQGQFHAIYHDAFSPAANRPLWEPAFLASLAGALTPGGRLVSFTVAGQVRRALAAAGLTVAKVPGPPGGKREVLVAQRPGPYP